MAKHPVPKLKTGKSKGKARYKSFERKTLRKLQGLYDARKHTFKKAESVNQDEKKQKELDKISKVKV